MKHKLLVTAIALKVANQTRQMHLADPITVRLSDMDFDVVHIHGLQVSDKDQLFVMTLEDNGHGQPAETWSELTIGDARSEKMIDAIHSRVMKTYQEVAA